MITRHLYNYIPASFHTHFPNMHTFFRKQTEYCDSVLFELSNDVYFIIL